MKRDWIEWPVSALTLTLFAVDDIFFSSPEFERLPGKEVKFKLQGNGV